MVSLGQVNRPDWAARLRHGGPVRPQFEPGAEESVRGTLDSQHPDQVLCAEGIARRQVHASLGGPQEEVKRGGGPGLHELACLAEHPEGGLEVPSSRCQSNRGEIDEHPVGARVGFARHQAVEDFEFPGGRLELVAVDENAHDGQTRVHDAIVGWVHVEGTCGTEGDSSLPLRFSQLAPAQGDSGGEGRNEH